MAYVANVSIHGSAHMGNAIKYIERDGKALPLNEFKRELLNSLEHLQNIQLTSGERVTCINCSSQNTYKEFENLRRAYKQDKGVIAHHYYQSFQKDDNVSPELAHQIGVELATKMFPDYQVVVSTHIDKEHIHNHIIVNSCNMSTGQKWHSNKKSLAEIRNESDRLCMQNGLGIINYNSEYSGIDRGTYRAGTNNRSWKVNLVQDLNEAVEVCKSKEEFINFLKKREYEIKYTDANITIQKIGEKKAIRVDTLAKQFGDKYKKDNLEKQMGYFSEAEKNKNDLPFKTEKNISEVKSNWEYYERNILRQYSTFPSTSKKIVRSVRTENILKNASSIAYSKSLFEALLKFFILICSLQKKKKRNINYERKTYRLLTATPQKRNVNKTYSYAGNIDYWKLKNSSGNCYSVRVSMLQLLKLTGQPVLYSARINRETGTVDITVKEKDKDMLIKIFEMENEQILLDEQNDSISNSAIYKNIKKIAEIKNEKVQYLVISAAQMDILKKNYINVAAFPKEEKYNIAFLPEQKNLIMKLIHQNQNNEQEINNQRNTKQRG